MLKNIHDAKFQKILKPIAGLVLAEDQIPYVTFNAFFNHTLMHEMSHGIGPGYIKVSGKDTEVKKELRETYSKIEECKADILGILNNLYLIEKRVYDREFEKEIWATNLAGIFRSVRFGISEAHGAGNAIIYNFFLEKHAFEYDESTKKVKVNFDNAYNALKDLANKILTIQATGNYEEAKKMIERYAVDSASLKTIREKLNKIPVDIKPVFEIEKMYN
jgi:hypothetical protein